MSRKTPLQLDRRNFGRAGLATAVGAILLGPEEVMAQEQRKKVRKIRRRPPQQLQQQAETIPTPPRVEGLNAFITASATTEFIELAFHLINDSEHTYILRDRQGWRTPPKGTITAFGQKYPVDFALPKEVSRRALMSRVIRFESTVLAPKNHETQQAVKTLYGTFKAQWPEGLKEKMAQLTDTKVTLQTNFLHNQLKQLGLQNALVSNIVELNIKAKNA